MINPTEYKTLFDNYYQALCQFAFAMTKDRMTAEDIVQDVFVNLWNKREELTINDNAKSYLFSAVRNKIYEQKRKKVLEIDIEKNNAIENYVVSNTNTENFDHYILIERLYTSIRQLPDRCSTIFALSKLEGKSNKIIADELNISIKTVENQMTKAFKILRNNLKDLL